MLASLAVFGGIAWFVALIIISSPCPRGGCSTMCWIGNCLKQRIHVYSFQFSTSSPCSPIFKFFFSSKQCDTFIRITGAVAGTVVDEIPGCCYELTTLDRTERGYSSHRIPVRPLVSELFNTESTVVELLPQYFTCNYCSRS